MTHFTHSQSAFEHTPAISSHLWCRSTAESVGTPGTRGQQPAEEGTGPGGIPAEGIDPERGRREEPVGNSSVEGVEVLRLV